MRNSRFGSKAGGQGRSLARSADSNRAHDEAGEADLNSGSARVSHESGAHESGSHESRPSSSGNDDRSKRLEYARKLLKQASEQPKSPPKSRKPDERDARNASNAPPRSQPVEPPAYAPDPFEDADPFEAFEQCAPSSADATPDGESVYSRSSERKRKTSVKEARNARRPQPSLKGRALGFLSRREYSRAELSRKLRPYADEPEAIDKVLDDMEREGWQSNERFVESVVHRRASRMGGARIVSELKRHAVGDALISDTAGKLAQTETSRAQAVWDKKFGSLPETPAERAKQARFLAARGFSSSTIGKVLKGGDEDWTEEIVDD
jgi:regulatory protein